MNRAGLDFESHRLLALPRRNVGFRETDEHHRLAVDRVLMPQCADEMVELHIIGQADREPVEH